MDNQPGSFFLVGPMGAGKSTIGRRLAELVDLPFVDSDHEIEARTGATIPLIFEVEGEAGFREREASVIDELTDNSHLVLATGGGAVTRPETRERLRARGFVIYLETSVDEQLRRTARDRNRPLLRTPDPRARLAALLAERDPLYRSIAHLIVNTDHQQPRQVAQRILKSAPIRALAQGG